MKPFASLVTGLLMLPFLLVTEDHRANWEAIQCPSAAGAPAGREQISGECKVGKK